VTATSDTLASPLYVIVDSFYNVYVSVNDGFHYVRKFTVGGNLVEYAGGGSTVVPVASVGTGILATTASLGQVVGLALDSYQNIYLVDYSGSIIVIGGGYSTSVTGFAYTSGYMYTLVGGGSSSGQQSGDLASLASLNNAWGVAIDSSNNVFMIDLNNYYVQQAYLVSGVWYITTVFGTGSPGGCLESTLDSGTALSVDSSDNLYILDQSCGVIKLSTTNRGYGVSSDDNAYYGTYPGGDPFGMAVTSTGTVYVSTHSTSIMTYDVADSAPRSSSTYFTGSYDGITGLCFDNSGNLYYASESGNIVERLLDVTTSQTNAATDGPTANPTAGITVNPTANPTSRITVNPTAIPTAGITVNPTAYPTAGSTANPSASPTAIITANPTSNPSAGSTANPSAGPTAIPTANPTAIPTAGITVNPTVYPTAGSTATPSASPTAIITANPTPTPSAGSTANPSAGPTAIPTANPTAIPTAFPSAAKTINPSTVPTANPTSTTAPGVVPTPVPSGAPTLSPSNTPFVKLTDKTTNSLTLTFGVTLKGGAMTCARINNIVPTASTGLVKLAYLDTNAPFSRYASDFEVIFSKNGVKATSQYIGGNPYGLNWGKTDIGTFDSSYRKYLTGCVYYTNYPTTPLLSGFNQVCVRNQCGSLGVYCSDSATFKGQLVIEGFTTTSTVSPAIFDTPCTAKGSIFTSMV
jgi:hypothetical protein